MLLLVTLGLVVASAVLLILGFVQDALGFIYLSMLCAGVAALALFIFARLARRRSTALAGAGIAGGSPSPYISAGDRAPARSVPEPQPAPDVTVVGSSAALRYESEPEEEPEYEADFAEDYEEAEPERVVVAAPPLPHPPEPVSVAAPSEDLDPWADERAGGAEDDWAGDWGDEVVFPIEDYDDLRVAEILPLLGQLDPDELQEVRDRELAGKARATIIDRIDDRLGRAPAPAVTTSPLPVITPEPPAVAPASAGARGAGPAGRSAKAPATRKAPAKRAAAAKATSTQPARSTAARPPAPTDPGPQSAGTRRGATRTSAAAGKATSAAPAKTTAARKSPARRAEEAPTAAKTVAKKAAAAKATPTRSAAGQAGAGRSAAGSAGSTKKAAAKKAAPAKRTARRDQ